MRLDAGSRALDEIVGGPVRARDADDGKIELPGRGEPLQRGKDVLERQIAAHTEDDEGVGTRDGHRQAIVAYKI